MLVLAAVLVLAGPKATPMSTPDAMKAIFGPSSMAVPEGDNPFLERDEALFEPGATLDGKPLPASLYASFEDGVGDMKDCYWRRSGEETEEIVVKLKITFDGDGEMRSVLADGKTQDVALCMVGLDFRIKPAKTGKERVVVLPVRLKPNVYRDAAGGSMGTR